MFVLAIILATITFILIIFPLFLKIQSYLNFKEKKLYFRVSIFRLKILGGYVQIINTGIAFHLSETKAIILSYESLDMRNQFSLTKDYKIYSINNLIEVSNIENSVLPFVLCSIENTFSKTIFTVLGYTKTWLNLKNDILIYEDNTDLRLNCEIVILFNLLTVTITIIKIILRKIINGRKE